MHVRCAACLSIAAKCEEPPVVRTMEQIFVGKLEWLSHSMDVDRRQAGERHANSQGS